MNTLEKVMMSFFARVFLALVFLFFVCFLFSFGR